MKDEAKPAGALITKLIACVLVLACLALGVIGLIIPIIPGLLFLALAAMIGAKHSPLFQRWVRKNTTTSHYLDHAERFSDLSLAGKLKLGGLLCAKAALEGIALIAPLASGLYRASRGPAVARQAYLPRIDYRSEPAGSSRRRS